MVNTPRKRPSVGPVALRSKRRSVAPPPPAAASQENKNKTPRKATSLTMDGPERHDHSRGRDTSRQRSPPKSAAAPPEATPSDADDLDDPFLAAALLRKDVVPALLPATLAALWGISNTTSTAREEGDHHHHHHRIGVDDADDKVKGDEAAHSFAMAVLSFAALHDGRLVAAANNRSSRLDWIPGSAADMLVPRCLYIGLPRHTTSSVDPKHTIMVAGRAVPKRQAVPVLGGVSVAVRSAGWIDPAAGVAGLFDPSHTSSVVDTQAIEDGGHQPRLPLSDTPLLFTFSNASTELDVSIVSSVAGRPTLRRAGTWGGSSSNQLDGPLSTVGGIAVTRRHSAVSWPARLIATDYANGTLVVLPLPTVVHLRSLAAEQSAEGKLGPLYRYMPVLVTELDPSTIASLLPSLGEEARTRRPAWVRTYTLEPEAESPKDVTVVNAVFSSADEPSSTPSLFESEEVTCLVSEMSPGARPMTLVRFTVPSSSILEATPRHGPPQLPTWCRRDAFVAAASMTRDRRSSSSPTVQSAPPAIGQPRGAIVLASRRKPAGERPGMEEGREASTFRYVVCDQARSSVLLVRAPYYATPRCVPVVEASWAVPEPPGFVTLPGPCQRHILLGGRKAARWWRIDLEDPSSMPTLVDAPWVGGSSSSAGLSGKTDAFMEVELPLPGVRRWSKLVVFGSPTDGRMALGVMPILCPCGDPSSLRSTG